MVAGGPRPARAPIPDLPTRAWRADAVVFGALLVLAYVVYGRVFEVRPMGEDNFYVLSWVDRAPASSLLRLDPAIYPEWRPLAYQTVWLQYQWAGLARMADYYVVNLGVWAATAWFVYRIVRRLTGSLTAACAAAVFLLTDVRAIPAVAWIVERQSSMACLFGLAGVWIALRSAGRRLTRAEAVGLGALLLASALSKEYGLAFSGALAAHALWERRRDVAVTAVAAGLTYAALRLALVGGAATPYCGDIGYFFSVRKGECYGANLSTAIQMLYNVVATAIGSVVRGLFAEDGRMAIARLPLLLSLCWLAIATPGWLRDRRALRLAALIIAGNTALSFMLYQPRNQLVALCGLAVMVGVGLAASRQRDVRPALRTAMTVAVGALLVAGTVRARALVGEEVDQLMRQDPCAGVVEHPETAPFARRVKALYGAGGDCGR